MDLLSISCVNVILGRVCWLCEVDLLSGSCVDVGLFVRGGGGGAFVGGGGQLDRFFWLGRGSLGHAFATSGHGLGRGWCDRLFGSGGRCLGWVATSVVIHCEDRILKGSLE